MKTPIISLSLRKTMINVIIAVMLISISTLAAVGVNFVTSSTVINGVYYSGNEKSNKISLMINVYWGTEYIDDMLFSLEQYNVKTTFFVGGTWAVKESDMLKKIYEQGHEIANHGYSHKDQDKISREANIKEISTTHQIVSELIGVEMNLFAPPSGAYNKTTVEVASNLNYQTIMWTRDTIDWRDKNVETIYKRAVDGAKGGDFVLMHPTECTKDALPRIIESLQSRGFTLTTVSDTMLS